MRPLCRERSVEFDDRNNLLFIFHVLGEAYICKPISGKQFFLQNCVLELTLSKISIYFENFCKITFFTFPNTKDDTTTISVTCY